MFGLITLLIAFAAGAVSIVCLIAGHMSARKKKSGQGETLLWGGHVASILSAAALTVCCAILVYGFMTGDTTMYYVAQNQSDSSGLLGWLFKLSGLWAGREGSLLFWAWLISVFNAIVAIRNMKKLDELDNMALMVAQIVLIAFTGVLLFSESNMPFTATPVQYLDASGNLQGAATLWGMNALLEHWAMAIHPPTLFIGYAGLTIPFAYAIGALIVNDSSKKWVDKCSRYAIFSWLFLGLGIGLGSVWAYVVLGWGGYWGWDPVENASLLPWLVGVALIHSFTVYRQRGEFKRWSIMSTCLTFSFVILGTFITRSGLVESVHAFAGDTVSLVLFLALIVLSVLAGAIGLGIRWKNFGTPENEEERLFSKNIAYLVNNVIMYVLACAIALLTMLPAFTSYTFPATSYDFIARPLGILYCLLIAVGPLLAWTRTDKKVFWKRARVPGICALVMFALLMVFYVTNLLPAYNDVISSGYANVESLELGGPAWYYNGLAIFGLLVASLLFFNALFMLGRGLRAYRKKHGVGIVGSLFGMFRNHASTYGGFLAHWAMAIILVGLIGSSMFVTEKVEYVVYDKSTETAQDFTIQDYTLKYIGNNIEEDGADVYYTVNFDVYKNDTKIDEVSPAIKLVTTTQQRSVIADVISFPAHDLFVVYNGMNEDGTAFSMDVRVNPLISFVWVGFGVLMLGTLLALVGKRQSDKRSYEDHSVSRGDGDEGEDASTKDDIASVDAVEK